MARRTKDITIEAENRDHGKTFVITEMPSEQAEWWAFRVLQALIGGNPDLSLDAPLSELAKAGIKAIGRIPADQAKPIYDEMMGCVSVRLPSGGTRDLLPTDIEEIGTRMKLRIEVGAMHLDFFGNGGA